MSRRLPDGEGLAGLFERMDPPPERLIEDARLAFARRLQPLRVLHLVADSLDEGPEKTRVGLAGEVDMTVDITKVPATRRVRFVGGRISVTMLVVRARAPVAKAERLVPAGSSEGEATRSDSIDYGITGEIEPPPRGLAWLERASNDMVVEIAPSGTFSCARLAAGPLRLVWSEHVEGAPRYFATEWFVL